MRKLSISALLLVLLALPALASGVKLTQSDFAFTADSALPATCAESTLGSLAADAAREALGADAAIVPGGLFSGTLETGAVFDSDVLRVIPADAPLDTRTVSPAELCALLEAGISSITVGEGDRIDASASADENYPQTSGFTWKYDASAPAGERVVSIRLGGEELDLADEAAHFTLACVSEETTGGITLRGALISYLSARDSVGEPTRRATVLGTSSYPLIDRFPIAALVCGCALLFLLAAIPKMKYEKLFSFRPRLSMFQKPGKMHPDETEERQ